jgi:hypothetical protein
LGKTVEELLRVISAAELAEWRANDELQMELQNERQAEDKITKMFTKPTR